MAKKKEKLVYVYENKDGRKDREKGIITYTYTAWHTFENEKERYILANRLEIVIYQINEKRQGLSDGWSSLSANHKIKIIGITIVSILSIIGLYLRYLLLSP